MAQGRVPAPIHYKLFSSVIGITQKSGGKENSE